MPSVSADFILPQSVHDLVMMVCVGRAGLGVALFRNGCLVRACCALLFAVSTACTACGSKGASLRWSELCGGQRVRHKQIPNVNADSIVGRWSTSWAPPKPDDLSATAWHAPHLVSLQMRPSPWALDSHTRAAPLARPHAHAHPHTLHSSPSRNRRRNRWAERLDSVLLQLEDRFSPAMIVLGGAPRWVILRRGKGEGWRANTTLAMGERPAARGMHGASTAVPYAFCFSAAPPPRPQGPL